MFYRNAFYNEAFYVDTAGAYTQVVAGTLSSSGVVVKSTDKILAGEFTSGGVVIKQISKIVSGTLTSAGTLAKQAGKVIVGGITSSGVLTATKTILMTLAGTLITAGTLIKQTNKSILGVVTSSGDVLRSISVKIFGVLTSSGVVFKQTQKIISGAVTSSGILLGEFIRVSGAVIRFVAKRWRDLITLDMNTDNILSIGGLFGKLVAVTSVRLDNNLISVYAGGLHSQPSLSNLQMENNTLTQESVDSILTDLVASLAIPDRVACVVNLGGTGNAAPTSSDNIDILVLAGWTVTTN